MMAIGIPEYRLPREVLQEEIERILDLGVELRLDTAMGRDFGLPDLEREGFKAIFLATGASKSRRLGVPGDELRGVIPATRFLKEVNLGEHPRLSGDVIVVGGGSTAMDAARSARRSGAASVTIVYRRGRADMPAQEEEVEAAEREGIVIRIGLAPAEVVGRDGGVVALRVDEMRPTGDLGAGGPGLWAPTGATRELPAATILVAIGEEPDPSILPEGAGIEVSGWAGIVADPRTLATGRAGIFAGGDVVSGPRTIIEAVAAGRRAAASVHEYLAGVADGEAEILRTVRYRTPPEPSALPRHRRSGRGPTPPLPVVDTTSFAATQPGFDEAAARAEASRCFRCDAVYGCPSVSVVRAGRGPADRPGLAASHPPSGGHVRAHACHTQEVRSDPRPGLRLLRRRRGLRRGHDRRGARRAVDPRPSRLHLARPYMVRTTGKFTLRLGADLWWIIYVALRDIFLLQVFLGSFIFFYPDVVAGPGPARSRAGWRRSARSRPC